jgi:hypothetical protein
MAWRPRVALLSAGFFGAVFLLAIEVARAVVPY